MAAPTFDTSYGSHKAPLRDGKVVYIHPEGRFYTLEFKSPVTGEHFRESYYFADRLTAEERHHNASYRDHEQQGRCRQNRHRHQSG